MLMALSNTHGWLVVATGNKSEMAVGYATLYGDMVGGYALLKDVYKTDVFRLARHLNERAGRELIPVTTIERPPTAELRADQRDDQSLPPYELLDPVLEAYVELDRSREELLEQSSTRRSWRGRSRSSTAPSTSAARRRRGSSCARAPSAATGARRSRTAGAAESPSSDWFAWVPGFARRLTKLNYDVRSTSAVTVRQFRTVRVVGQSALGEQRP